MTKSNSNQVGGTSDFSSLWRSWEMSPAELSRITLERIDCAPMFNPLRTGTVIPTGNSGITPTGVYLANTPATKDSCITMDCSGKKPLPQTGGGKKKKCCGLVRTPVYYSETNVKGGCTMPPARPIGAEIGCKARAMTNANADYETYLHLKAMDAKERVDRARKCCCGSGVGKCGLVGCGCGCRSGGPCRC